MHRTSEWRFVLCVSYRDGLDSDWRRRRLQKLSRILRELMQTMPGAEVVGLSFEFK